MSTPRRTQVGNPLDQLVTPEILAALEAQFPDTLPEGEVSAAQIHILIGQQTVIRALRHSLGRIEGNLLTRSVFR